MSERTILAVPGLAATSPAFRAALWEMAARNGWDADAIAAVMSIESGFRANVRNPLPGQTATGLIQFTDSTARSLGVADGAAGIARMTDVQQLPLVERYYQRAFAGRREAPRVVDYYLAGWGRGIGQPEGYVLADSVDPLTLNDGRDNLYTLNRGLDVSGDGTITVGDLVRVMGGKLAQAHGERLSAAPVALLAGVSGSSAGGGSWMFAALGVAALWFSRKELKRWLGQ